MFLSARQLKALIMIAAAIALLAGSVMLFRPECAETGKTGGSAFHEFTKLQIKDVLTSLTDTIEVPAMSKKYKNARVIALPKPDFTGLSFETALKDRRSVRGYTEQPVALRALSQLLFAAQGVTGREQGYHLRAAPSAGALYPIEIYVAVSRVSDLKPGLYHYVPSAHSLECMQEGNFAARLGSAALGQEMVEDAGACFILTAVFERATHKYGERGYRYAYMEAGHISQNIFLQAVSLGLGSVCVGAFFDDTVNRLIDVDGTREAAVYIHCVGCI